MAVKENSAAQKPAKAKKGGLERHNYYGILFCLPFVIAFLVFNVYPVFRTFQMSFLSYKGFGKETFVARLSGSTAEFLHIWQLMFFGPSPFRWSGDSLRLVLAPFVPSYLMPEDGVIEAVFLGSVQVIYHASGLTELVPGKTHPVHWTLTDADGGKRSAEGPALCDKDACAVRAGQITEINIIMK